MTTSSYLQRVEPLRHQPSPRYVSGTEYALSDQQIRSRQQAAHTVVIAQPSRNVWHFEHPWSTGLCACFDNCKECCCAYFCPCCYECQLFKRAGENMCTCVCPGALFALRSKIRTAFRIEGGLCSDFCTTTFCPCCASIQMTRELYLQGI